jgi:hypothetical protein
MEIIQDVCTTASTDRLKQKQAGEAYITNYPNPFGYETTIKYFSNGDLINISITDVHGRLISTLVNDNIPHGTHEITFNASNLKPGTYYCTYQGGLVTQTRSLLKVR